MNRIVVDEQGHRLTITVLERSGRKAVALENERTDHQLNCCSHLRLPSWRGGDDEQEDYRNMRIITIIIILHIIYTNCKVVEEVAGSFSAGSQNVISRNRNKLK